MTPAERRRRGYPQHLVNADPDVVREALALLAHPEHPTWERLALTYAPVLAEVLPEPDPRDQ